MPYTLTYSQRALRDLKALPHHDRERILLALEGIATEPLTFIHKLEGSPLFSFRVGNFRILLDVHRQSLVILVIGIGHRKNIYHRV
ncbi:MAG: type II toxin-antitoxin system RelE/ParE family toxin [Methanoregulaceae archaeon]|jgi:mRNA interferase RelE/StbE|nr:type II toxin-antitoxin system RelE/ParE family toxin [Methanoregulaceae archaeon]